MSFELSNFSINICRINKSLKWIRLARKINKYNFKAIWTALTPTANVYKLLLLKALPTQVFSNKVKNMEWGYWWMKLLTPSIANLFKTNLLEYDIDYNINFTFYIDSKYKNELSNNLCTAYINLVKRVFYWFNTSCQSIRFRLSIQFSN